MRILLVEDDRAMARSVELSLQRDGIEVLAAELGEEAVKLGMHELYDLILLDLQLPDMSGLEVLKKLRLANVHTPVVILSGDAAVQSRVKTLTAGADDYLTKPFRVEELMARIRAVARRSQSKPQSLITTGKMTVNLDAKSVDVAGNNVRLTVKEYQLIEALSLRKGSVLSKEAILNQIYGGMDVPTLKIIDVFVCKLRKKLAEATNGHHYIETVWGLGYEMRDPSGRAAAA
jgi:two-component system cell cycle response regulator CtrA